MELVDKLEKYLQKNFEKPRFGRMSYKNLMEMGEASYSCSSEDINTFIEKNKDKHNFQQLLFSYIDDKNLKDSDVYNKVNIDRRLFSKIRSNINYHPSKDTVILLCIALNLNEDEAVELLDSASYTLPKNNVFDLIIRYCFIEHIYDINTINDYLYSYNCKLLGQN